MVLGRQDYQWKHEPCFYGWKDGAAHYFTDCRSETTVFDEKKPPRNDLHPTMKPLKLIGRQVLNSSKEGELVLDLFGGSGSTLIACEQAKRRNCSMEFDPHYCDVIIDRWERFTGDKAVLIRNTKE
jgi:DNA modification methylase